MSLGVRELQFHAGDQAPGLLGTWKLDVGDLERYVGVSLLNNARTKGLTTTY